MDDLQTLLRPLVERPETAPQPVEWIAHRARWRTRRRRGLTVATAALPLAIPLWLVARDEPSATVDVSTEASTSAPTTVGPTTTSPTTTTAPTATAATDPFGAAPPWAGAPLPASAAPAYVDAAANAPATAAKCPVVAPDDLGEGAGAVARTTTSGHTPDPQDSWGVEYDLAGAPGHAEDQAPPTAGAGRDTFSIFTTLMPAPPPGMAEAWGTASVRELVTDRPQVHTWSDGSVAGWGGHLVEADPDLAPPLPPPNEPADAVIQFQLEGADPSCLYAVHSLLGEDHAFHLVEHLRRVEGL